VREVLHVYRGEEDPNNDEQKRWGDRRKTGGEEQADESGSREGNDEDLSGSTDPVSHERTDDE